MASVPWEVVEVGVAGYAVLRPSEPGNDWPLQQTVTPTAIAAPGRHCRAVPNAVLVCSGGWWGWSQLPFGLGPLQTAHRHDAVADLLKVDAQLRGCALAAAQRCVRTPATVTDAGSRRS